MRLPTEPGTARETGLSVARHAVELGITLIDTAHMYGGGANEELAELEATPHRSPWPGCSTARRSSSRSRARPGSTTWRRTPRRGVSV
ncbi:aldo/keto reductase [Streptomyces sp. NPDC051064]|uniref:aldo/keto reductase n=1 Tax=Streptomyces sp. NPDC051064 TaxID=3365641 RepID=UPI0037B98361